MLLFLVLVLGIVENSFSACKGVCSLALPLLIRSWSFALGAFWSYMSNKTIFLEEGNGTVECRSLQPGLL